MSEQQDKRIVSMVGARLARLAGGGTLPEWDRVAATAQVLTLKPGDVVYKQGVRHPYIYSVVSGLLRATADRGTDTRTLRFARPGEVNSPSPLAPPGWMRTVLDEYGEPTADMRAALSGDSDHGLAACVPSVVVRADSDVVGELMASRPEWTRLGLTIGTYHLTVRGARMKDLLTLTAEERYVKFITEDPEIARKVSQRDIAAVLGITPEALSRATARVRARQRAATPGPAGH